MSVLTNWCPTTLLLSQTTTTAPVRCSPAVQKEAAQDHAGISWEHQQWRGDGPWSTGPADNSHPGCVPTSALCWQTPGEVYRRDCSSYQSLEAHRKTLPPTADRTEPNHIYSSAQLILILCELWWHPFYSGNNLAKSWPNFTMFGRNVERENLQHITLCYVAHQQ